MKRMNTHNLIRRWLIPLFICVLCLVSIVQAERSGWQRQEVNWRMSGGTRIKAINYPQGKTLPLFTQQESYEQIKPRKKLIHLEADPRITLFNQQLTAPIYAIVIDSPPVDGFVPWVVVSVTDKRLDELEFDGVPENSLVGRYPVGVDPKTDYVIGIFDTGASAHVMGYADATKAGLYNNSKKFLTSNTSVISGVVDAVDAWVSQPLGLFIDGLGIIDPNGLLRDLSNMRGESNVAIMVGQNPGDRPDLPTAIGSPLSVFFTTAIYSDKQITVNRNGDEFISPEIRIYEHDDPCIPSYPNTIPLELRPLGAYAVQYIPSLEGFFEFLPASPSVIIGNLSQSLFFIHSVDLAEGNKKAIDKDRFMLDTGAQVTVIGSRIAARLDLDITNPEFEVEIQGVTGSIVTMPGFYIDSLEIPALGEWLSFTNVPVVLLDVASPEGGTLDGIIGMNLFVGLNLVLRGGGLFLQDEPLLEFEIIPAILTADIAPKGGDGVIDFLDFAVIAEAWLTTITSTNWNPKADLAPQLNSDGSVDFLDLAIFAEYWMKNTAQ